MPIFEVNWSERISCTRFIEANSAREAVAVSSVMGRASHVPKLPWNTTGEYNLTEMKARRIDPGTLDKDAVIIVGGAYAGEHEDGSGPYIGFSTVDAGAFQPRRR